MLDTSYAHLCWVGGIAASTTNFSAEDSSCSIHLSSNALKASCVIRICRTPAEKPSNPQMVITMAANVHSTQLAVRFTIEKGFEFRVFCFLLPGCKLATHELKDAVNPSITVAADVEVEGSHHKQNFDLHCAVGLAAHGSGFIRLKGLVPLLGIFCTCITLAASTLSISRSSWRMLLATSTAMPRSCSRASLLGHAHEGFGGKGRTIRQCDQLFAYLSPSCQQAIQA